MDILIFQELKFPDKKYASYGSNILKPVGRGKDLLHPL